MNALRKAEKIRRRRVLLSALEEAKDFVYLHGPSPEWCVRYPFLLSKLDQEIAWVKSRIERLEATK